MYDGWEVVLYGSTNCEPVVASGELRGGPGGSTGSPLHSHIKGRWDGTVTRPMKVEFILLKNLYVSCAENPYWAW